MTAALHIVGGGLAGLALGRSLAQAGFSVRLDEAGSYPRHRVCGEFIAGLRPEVIAALDLAPLLTDALPLRTVAWFAGDRLIGRYTLPTPAWGLSRWDLDARLADGLTAAGGELNQQQRTRLPSTPETVAPGLIEASGRIPATGPSRWLGLKRHFLGLKLEADLEVHLFPGGYLGMSRLPGNTVNTCGLFRRAALATPKEWPTALGTLGMPILQRRLEAAEADSESNCAVSALDFNRETSAPGWMRLGDTLGMIPPYTGHGMAMALESAFFARPLLHDFLAQKTSWETTLTAFEHKRKKHFRRRLTVARWLHPLLLRPVWQTHLARLARWRVLPFRTLYQLTHS